MNVFFKASGTILLALCLLSSGANAADGIPVFVSIVPQKYFVEKVGGDRVEVSVMVKAGANPAVYEPSPSQMVALSSARLYFAIGVPFEDAWLPRITQTNPGLNVVLTQEGIEKIPMKEHHHGEHDAEDHEKEHQPGQDAHVIADPHIWLSPPLVMRQARNIMRALVAIDPEHSSAYLDNYKAFISQIVALDMDITRLFSDLKQDCEFMVFHPAWGYFAHAYGLKQTPVEIEGKSPKPAQLQKLISHARKKGIRVIFVQPQISPQIAVTIAEAINGRAITADPLAEDWAQNLMDVATLIKEAFSRRNGGKD